jgi:hypothetical protein
LFEGIAARRVFATQAVGRLILERLFPDGSPDLSPEQRMRVTDKLLHETCPATMMDTLLSGLDEVTDTPPNLITTTLVPPYIFYGQNSEPELGLSPFEYGDRQSSVSHLSSPPKLR